MSLAKKIRVLIAPDKFRPKMSALRVCQVISSQLSPQKYHFDYVPLADGGQGSLQCIGSSLKGERKYITARDPLFRPINTFYLLDKKEKAAYIEMAKASGQSLLTPGQKNPLLTSTIGTGDLINDALKEQCSKIMLFIGGSATNQGGIGAASALGYQFYDQQGNLLAPTGGNLQNIAQIRLKDTNMIETIKKASFLVATDVENPLTGPNGATYVFGPQKGANELSLKALEKGMINLNNVLTNKLNLKVGQIKGGGAAGGLGAGAIAFFNARIVNGVNTIMDIVKLREKVKNTDIVVTGEGKVDSQTLNGKLVKGVVDLAQQQGKPIIIFCGKSQIESKAFGPAVQIIPNQKLGMQDNYCIENAQNLLKKSVNQYFNAK